jgi:hypothetical protein
MSNNARLTLAHCNMADKWAPLLFCVAAVVIGVLLAQEAARPPPERIMDPLDPVVRLCAGKFRRLAPYFMDMTMDDLRQLNKKSVIAMCDPADKPLMTVFTDAHSKWFQEDVLTSFRGPPPAEGSIIRNVSGGKAAVFNGKYASPTSTAPSAASGVPCAEFHFPWRMHCRR